MTTANGSAAAAGAGGAGGDNKSGNPGAGAANGGAAPGNGSAGSNGGDNGGASPFSGLQDAGNLDWVKAKGVPSLDALVTSSRELETKIGQAILPLDENATDAQRGAFYDKLGRPKTAAEYKFDRPKGLPETAPYDTGMAAEIGNIAHALGLNQRQASVLHDHFFAAAHKGAEDRAAKDKEQISAGHQAIVKEWGEPDGAKHKRMTELSNRTIRQFGGDALLTELKTIGALGKDGDAKSPQLAFMLAKVGEQLFAEDTLWQNPGGAVNPFADASVNLKEQGRIIKQDPDRARALIRATGANPAEWSL